jgi:SAM-dependent methyltransferase
MLTSRAKELVESWGGVAIDRDLYGVEGSAFYDLITQTDRSEVREVLAVARRIAGDIVDLGCGSGRLTIPLLALGRRVTGVDLSPEMLRILGERSDALGLSERLRTVESEMSAFDPCGAVGMALIGATSISLLSRSRRVQLFRRAGNYLATGGRLILTATMELDDRCYVSGRQTVPDARGGELAYYFFQEVDVERGIRIVNFVVDRPSDDGSGVVVFTGAVQLVSVSSVGRELEVAGFSVVATTPVRARSDDQRGLTLLECACPA